MTPTDADASSGRAERIRDEVVAELPRYAEWLHSPAENELLVRIHHGQLPALAAFLAERRMRLVTVVGNDERELEDRCFKIYYVFEHLQAPLVVLAEYLLQRGSTEYDSLREVFRAADPFERQLSDLLGLRPRGRRARSAGLLHPSRPEGFRPLQRDQPTVAPAEPVIAPDPDPDPTGPDAELPPGRRVVLPIGPVHAGVIEPGLFRFRVEGETIEDVEIRLGFTHRGLERLFQAQLPLLDGWRLAEQVSGDSCVAHALAYCRAAEILAEGEPPTAAVLLREVLLELERIHNHVADVGTLAEDVALDVPAAEISVLRESLLRLNQRVSGHRYLRGAVRPGGVALPRPLDDADLSRTLSGCVGRFVRLAATITSHPGFRTRTIGVGVLTEAEVLELGVTGLVARASTPRSDTPRGIPGEEGAGDVYARCLRRIAEVEQAHRRVLDLVTTWSQIPEPTRSDLRSRLRIRPENNYTFAVGRSEGFRGEVVYWLMQDKLDGIYRCKVADPSTVNWPALRQALLPRTGPSGALETVLADFPLVNKSFGLSYAGTDL
ncbi:MAG: NADH-quinone oxidoreductase subunit C [Kineosporiaceae bacterium]